MSSKKADYKENDVLVKFGKLYKIFQIKTKEFENNTKKIVYYKPLFVKNKREEMICSIPLSNLNKAFLRKPFAKEEYKKFLKGLSQTSEEFKEKVQIKSYADLSTSDDLEKKSLVISHLWYRKQDPEINISTSESNLLKELINSVTEELAFVLGLNIDSAKDTILANLNGEASVE